MVGIVGYIKNNLQGDESSLLDRMSKLIRYSERDRIDKWSDGFLTISRVHHGVINPEPQPICNEDKTLLILMDGEVFDYEERKLELIRNNHKFKFKNNDAEYCLHLYEELGEDAFRELNGSFCIVIYNLTTRELLIVNDRFSSRPIFYYLTDKGTLLFGTQLSALLISHEVPRELDMLSVFEFFTFQRVLGYKTFYKKIDILIPATILHYKNGSISFNTYWEIKYKEEKQSEDYYINKLAEAIKISVTRRMSGNYRFGLLLSGGLDSRSILAASDKKPICFTIGDFENQEVEIAKKIAKSKNCDHIFLKRSLDYYANFVDLSVEIGDGMYSFNHAHNIGFFNEINKNCDILLNAYGYDIMLKGLYLPKKEISFLGRALELPILSKLPTQKLINTFLKRNKYSLFAKNPKQLFVAGCSHIFVDLLVNDIERILKSCNNNATNNYNKFEYLSFLHNFSKNPAYLYLLSTRHFIDERSIIFDNDLFDVYLEMPPELRFNGRIYRKALKKLDPDIAKIPNANTGLSPTQPILLEWFILKLKSVFKAFSIRKKILPHPTYTEGSWPNFAELIRHNEKLKKIIKNTIEDPKCLDPTIFNIQRIKNIFKEHLDNTSDYTEFLLLLITFGRWYKKWHITHK